MKKKHTVIAGKSIVLENKYYALHELSFSALTKETVFLYSGNKFVLQDHRDGARLMEQMHEASYSILSDKKYTISNEGDSYLIVKITIAAIKNGGFEKTEEWILY